MVCTSFRSSTRMPAASSRRVLRSELDTARGKSTVRFDKAAMKNATVDPLPTPTTLPGPQEAQCVFGSGMLLPRRLGVGILVRHQTTIASCVPLPGATSWPGLSLD